MVFETPTFRWQKGLSPHNDRVQWEKCLPPRALLCGDANTFHVCHLRRAFQIRKVDDAEQWKGLWKIFNSIKFTYKKKDQCLETVPKIIAQIFLIKAQFPSVFHQNWRKYTKLKKELSNHCIQILKKNILASFFFKKYSLDTLSSSF